MDIGLDDRRVHSHLAAADDSSFLSDRHDPAVDLLDDLRAQCNAKLAQRLGVRDFGGADPRELAIHKVGADLPLERRVAPVANVLEYQETDDDVDRCALASAGAAVRPSRCQGLVGHVQQQRVVQHAVDVAHPVFPQIADLFGDKAVAEVELAAAQLDHFRPACVPWPVEPWPSACARRALA